jgi:hypothetical protein
MADPVLENLVQPRHCYEQERFHVGRYTAQFSLDILPIIWRGIRNECADLRLHTVTYLVTRHVVWIGKRICWTRNYKYLRQYHCVTHSKDHCNYSTREVSSVFTSRCLVVAFNGERSPSTGFLNCPRPQLPASHFSQLQISVLSLPGKHVHRAVP